MPASFNKVLLMGNLTRDPELRYIPSGQAVTSFTLAVNRAYASQSGEKKEEVSFIRVVVWGRLGEVCNEYLKKGSPAFVEGRLQTRSWEAQDGSKRSTTEVVAQSVQFLPRAPRSGGASTETGEIPQVQEADTALYEEAAENVSPKGASSRGKSSESEEDIPF
ncbi:MAG: single-stranded DNA-binding protein [Candidatus Omnitrophica bacterium]|nr:single-stranded DNA-binding protein [Candidatus Omnitrophota bacterium]